MFERILMMGVSPVTLDDLTSGYDIALNISANTKFNRMLGFGEDDVRQMIEYYRGQGKISIPTDELVAKMKPWYDNYCFAKDSYGKEPSVFNCDMVTYFLHNLIDTGMPPEQMIDPNTRTDYTKMKRLIRLDHLDGNRKGIIHKIAEEGYIYAPLIPNFPSSDLIKPKMFQSLLFYYGMFTITGVEGAMLRLCIPNNNVRKQYYDYLLEEYQQIQPVDTTDLDMAYYDAAVDGNWQPAMRFIADAYTATTSVRQLIEGERNIQGFFLAYLNLYPYYLTLPDTVRYPMVAHAYIIELKYLLEKDGDGKAEWQWNEATAQLHAYAASDRVKALVGNATLHLVAMQFKGLCLHRMGEV